jgi:hypothetical protein
MRENKCRLFSFRPKPDKWNGATTVGANRSDHHLFEELVDRAIDRPFGKVAIQFSVQFDALQGTPDGNWQDWTSPVVKLANQRVGTESRFLVSHLPGVGFQAKRRSDFGYVEGHIDFVTAALYLLRDVG